MSRDRGVYHHCMNRNDLKTYAADGEVLILTSSRKGLIVEDNMNIFNKVGCIIKCGSGTDNIDIEACTKRRIIVAHTLNDPTEPASDHL